MLDYRSYHNAFKTIAEVNGWADLHTPKNLAQAVLQESAELCAEFQWLTDQQSCELTADKLAKVGSEVADVALYLFALCEALGLDLDDAIEVKQKLNEQRFGVAKD
ncbi:nucleotide pyrophosphohydrolase [Simiduia curdlanivorans]|uniref:MazG-like family protein n=1 Tax=Simiduia curdlanivorans TaxID=1492769 RepID=A0ABV8V465_9GAMM|nr:nucleotide pyrophosphohydrolase [Simiduia curdlanivorans]MDN3640099.1 nucleotide pyrophosphohydrolase [Simiduia curdlanivorans]